MYTQSKNSNAISQRSHAEINIHPSKREMFQTVHKPGDTQIFAQRTHAGFSPLSVHTQTKLSARASLNSSTHIPALGSFTVQSVEEREFINFQPLLWSP